MEYIRGITMQGMANMMISNLGRYKKLQDDRFDEITTKYDLRKIDIEIMMYLDSCGDNDTARDIAAAQRFTKGHISQSNKRLFEKGYITAVKDQKDQRVSHLSLTNKAKKNIPFIVKKTMNKIFDVAFEGVTDEELKVVKKVCLVVNSNMESGINV